MNLNKFIIYISKLWITVFQNRLIWDGIAKTKITHRNSSGWATSTETFLLFTFCNTKENLQLLFMFTSTATCKVTTVGFISNLCDCLWPFNVLISATAGCINSLGKKLLSHPVENQGQSSKMNLKKHYVFLKHMVKHTEMNTKMFYHNT